MRKKPRSSKYILIKKDPKIDIKEQYELTYKEAVKLKELTKGKINIFRTGSVAKTGLQLFYDLCNPPEPDDICSKEAEILEKCVRGSLIYGIPYKGKGFKYDICSSFPSVMIAKNNHIPYGKPTFEKLKTEEFNKLEYLKYGIYHVKVHNPDFRVFKENKKNWYTHTDLNFAKNKLHYKLELIEDEDINAMIYVNLKSVTKIFKPYIDYLFGFKKQGIKEVKKYINALWGALCQKNEMVVSANKTFDSDNIVSMMPNFKELKNCNDIPFHVATIIKKEQIYETNFARIAPFIVACGRSKIVNMILPNIDKVVRTHTDGIILNKPIEHIILGDNIGDLKFEEEGECHILNANDFKFNNIIHGRKSAKY
jgi:hypothetical protein